MAATVPLGYLGNHGEILFFSSPNIYIAFERHSKDSPENVENVQFKIPAEL